jgi:hypothetical protein
MRKVAIVVLVVCSGCTHIPSQGAEVRHAELLRPPPGGLQPDMVTAAPAPGEWTTEDCKANALAQDVWSGLALGGTTLAGVTGFSAIEWQTDEAKNRAKFAAVISGGVGIVAGLVANNVKNRGAEYCPVAKSALDPPER